MVLWFLIDIQRFFAPKGIYASWERLGDISATVNLLQHVRKQVGRALGIAYHGITHVSPDTSASVQTIMHKIAELGLHAFTLDREGNSSVKQVIDTLASGEHKLKSSTLATFNKKVRGMIAGEELLDTEEDEIPSVAFDHSGDNDDD